MATKKRLPYFKFFPADFLGGVTWLTNEQVGVYIQLLCVEWEGGPLPRDLAAIERRVPGVTLAWPALQPKFIETPDGWINERLEAERDAAKGRSAHGKKGSDGRWGDAQAMPEHMPEQCPSMNRAMQRASDCVSVSDSVSVSGFGSGESVRGGAEEAINDAIAELEASNGSSMAYTLSTDPDVATVWNAVPLKWRTERVKNYLRIKAAIASIARDRKIAPPEAAAWLSVRIAEYCHSPLGSSTYRGKLATWLDAGRWDDGDGAWDRAEAQPVASQAAPKPERRRW